MSSIQSLKAAITTRVNPEEASKLYYEARAMGNPATCPASAVHADVDEFGRPLGGSGYRMLYMADPSCSHYNYPASRMLRHENASRPILGPCNPGDRGSGDFLLGSIRDHFPMGIYGEDGNRGKFVSPYIGGLMRPLEDIPQYTKSYTPDLTRPLTLSHNSLIKPYYG